MEVSLYYYISARSVHSLGCGDCKARELRIHDSGSVRNDPGQFL